MNNKNDIWFIYDGECPVCTSAAQMLRIKKDFGTLHTLNARENDSDTLIKEINSRGLDLDEGMVIYANDYFYHGKEALQFMADYGEANNILMLPIKGLFWSNTLSSMLYPWLRGVRNLLLKLKGVDQIDNLQLKTEPTFKSIFGNSWGELPPVMKKHYSIRPYSKDETQVNGTLAVMCKAPLTWLSPLMKLMGQIPTYNENHVPVTVYFQSDLNSKSFHLNRIFNFSKGKPYNFHSRMFQIRSNEVVELMPFGLGWKACYDWDGEKIILSHRGYVLNLFGHFMPLPLTLLLGTGYAEERPVNDHTFDMKTHITHPWWGKIYEYKGRFEVPE